MIGVGFRKPSTVWGAAPRVGSIAGSVHYSAMQYRRLGAEGPIISVVGYGGSPAGGDVFGANESDDVVVEAVRAALDAGINWIDTAESYGAGRSEQLVRSALAGHGDVLVFTKVSPVSWGGTGVRPNDVRTALEGSLRRLDAEHIDVYQLHAPDPSVPVEETWGAMAALVEGGLTRWIGLSNVDADAVTRCQRVHPVVAVQNELSLTAPGDTTTLLPWLAERGIGYLAYGPMAYGVLTGSMPRDCNFARGDWRGDSTGGSLWQRLFGPGRLNTWLDRVDRLRPIAERLDVPVSSIALAWVVGQLGVTAAIAGSRAPKHVRANAAAGDLELAPSVLAEIGSIFT